LRNRKQPDAVTREGAQDDGNQNEADLPLWTSFFGHRWLDDNILQALSQAVSELCLTITFIFDMLYLPTVR
jgi:hypothetical protein